MKRRIIEIDDDDINRVILPNGYVTSECMNNIREAFKRSTVISAEYNISPYVKGLYDACEKVKERRKSEAELATLSNDSDKHIYARILLDDIIQQIGKIMSAECKKYNLRFAKRWMKKHMVEAPEEEETDEVSE